jgi:tyrosinase
MRAGERGITVSVRATPTDPKRSPETIPVTVNRPVEAKKRTRYNIYEMPEDARKTLFDAINKLKSMGIWDYFVKSHLQVSSDRLMGRLETDAHNSPAFTVWHRMMLDLYERSLMAAGLKEGYGAPYWRTEYERGTNGDCMWADNMFGNRNGQVMKGFMAGWRGYGDMHAEGQDSWPIVRQPPNQLSNIGQRVDRWEALLKGTDFPTFATMRTNLEGIHNVGHTNVGGDMNTMASPNDPIFYLVHMRTEKQFTEWQKNPRAIEAKKYYGTNSQGVEAKLTDKLTPWGVSVSSWMEPTAGVVFDDSCNSALCRRCGTTRISNNRRVYKNDDN